MAGVQGESFGINDECYKVGKVELLSFFNEHLDLNLTKIEQCGTGAVYCQIMDKLYPGTFNFSAVKWNAKSDYEYMDNYKVLNNAFIKNGVKKNLEVDKLVKVARQEGAADAPAATELLREEGAAPLTFGCCRLTPPWPP